jgi:hypothetical protein
MLLRVLPLLVLSVFINPDNEACEPISDLEASVISIRYSRSFSNTVKIAKIFLMRALIGYARVHVKLVL